MKNLLLVLLILFSIACSTTRTVEVPIETVRTEYINKIQYDSVYIKDSIDKFIKEDTVYLYKQHTLFKYKYFTDTVVKIDSIPYPVTIETVKEVNVLRWYQEALMYAGILFILIMILRIFK